MCLKIRKYEIEINCFKETDDNAAVAIEKALTDVLLGSDLTNRLLIYLLE